MTKHAKDVSCVFLETSENFLLAFIEHCRRKNREKKLLGNEKMATMPQMLLSLFPRTISISWHCIASASSYRAYFDTREKCISGGIRCHFLSLSISEFHITTCQSNGISCIRYLLLFFSCRRLFSKEKDFFSK